MTETLFKDYYLNQTSFIGGGETTVNLLTNDELNLNKNVIRKGGRNMEIVLKFLTLAATKPIPKNFTFYSFGTDGQDGPTEYAGAVIDQNDVKKFQNDVNMIKLAEKCLKINNSCTFFEVFDKNCLLECGLTGTNVMDIQGLVFE